LIFSYLSEVVGNVHPLYHTSRFHRKLQELLTDNLITWFHNSSIIGGHLSFGPPKHYYWGN